MIVVSDTSPINYLVLVEQIDRLRDLYRRVIIPSSVYEELQALARRITTTEVSVVIPIVVSEWQVFHEVSEVRRIQCLRRQFEIPDCLADRQLELMPEEQTGELSSVLVPLICDRQEVCILCEENAA